MLTGENIVQREVDSSIILFDVIAVALWLYALYANKQWTAMKFCGIGFVVYYVVDAIIWMAIMKVRVIESSINPYLVEIWLQLGPGVIHPSFFCLMLEGTFGPRRKEVKREFWIILFIGVQFVPAFLQSSFCFYDTIKISRNMNTQRWFFVLVAVLGYLYLEKNRVSGTNMLKIFMYSVIVEGFFEFSLLFSGIRKATFQTIFIDSILEFNVGAGIIVALWRMLYSKDERALMDFGPEGFGAAEKKDLIVSFVCLQVDCFKNAAMMARRIDIESQGSQIS